MDLIDKLGDLASRIEKLRPQLQTEEATKNALIMPFINALGYDVFNPLEVVPEFTADVGTKKGEKVDYAVMQNGEPIILVECKVVGADLDKLTPSQLYRYFSVTAARFAVFTDGIRYQFFSDLDSPNKMDERPFFEFRMPSVDEQVAAELKKFSKESFDLDAILSTASDLKYLKGIKRSLTEEWINPSEDLIRLLSARVYSGRFTQAIKEQFGDITKRALHEFVSERVNMRLKSALERDAGAESLDTNSTQSVDSSDDARSDNGIVTTEDEIEGFYIVKSIIREVVDASRVFMRDTQSYCGVLLDDNNRKPICRLFFNSSQKYFGIFDQEKNVARHPISELNDIYQFADDLKRTAQMY
jgi:hypothetical protein